MHTIFRLAARHEDDDVHHSNEEQKQQDRISTLVDLESSRPWATKVSDLIPSIKTEVELSMMKNAKSKRYYEDQNELIEFMEEWYIHGFTIKPVHEEDEIEKSLLANLALNVSFGLNIGVVLLYVIVLILTGSVAMFASVIDSCLDILSGLVLFITQRSIDQCNPYLYPQGKERLGPVGILVFATVMSVASLQIFREAIQRLVDGASGHIAEVSVDRTVYILVAINISSKLMMGFICWVIAKRTGSAAVNCYAIDHLNDTVLNSVGLGGMIIAAKIPSAWAADPIAACVISLLILHSWMSTGMIHVDQIVGKSAHHNLLKKIAFIARNHDENVLFVDTTRAYHFGEKFLVEVDIVLPRQMPLEQAHDIGESLQIKIEGLEEVERTFCHLDFEFEHKPEHKPVLFPAHKRSSSSTSSPHSRGSSHDVSTSLLENETDENNSTGGVMMVIQRAREVFGKVGRSSPTLEQQVSSPTPIRSTGLRPSSSSSSSYHPSHTCAPVAARGCTPYTSW